MSQRQQNLKRLKASVRRIGEKLAENPEQTKNLAITGILAYLGYKYLPEDLPVWLRIAWGPMAKELATTPSSGDGVSLGIGGFSFPVNSQVAGLTMLATLGFASVPWQAIGDVLNEQAKEEKEVLELLNYYIGLGPAYVDETTLSELSRARMAILSRASPREQTMANAWFWIEMAREEGAPGPSQGGAR